MPYDARAMLMFHRLLRPVCCVLIGALLFAQAAFATRPCVEADMSVAAAVAAQSGGGCCETGVVEIKLCAVQCADGNKLPGPGNPFTIYPPAAVASVTLLPLSDYGAAISAYLRHQRDLVADPPPALRFCRLLI